MKTEQNHKNSSTNEDIESRQKKRFPWKTMIIGVALLSFGLSPLPEKIYDDLKAANKQRKENKLLGKFSKQREFSDLTISGVTNQKVTIKYKAKEFNVIQLIFEIIPYTKHKDSLGSFNISFTDADGFTIHDSIINEEDLVSLFDESGEIIGGSYEVNIDIDFADLEKLHGFHVGVSMSESRKDFLTGMHEVKEAKKRAKIEEAKEAQRRVAEAQRRAIKEAELSIKSKWSRLRSKYSIDAVKAILGEPNSQTDSEKESEYHNTPPTKFRTLHYHYIHPHLREDKRIGSVQFQKYDYKSKRSGYFLVGVQVPMFKDDPLRWPRK